MNLVLDSETSGFKESRLLQLACILQDANFKDVATINLLVRPTFDIEPGAEAVHGISKEKAMECGLPVEVVVAVFAGLASKSKMFVGHNLDFDMGVVEGEMRRLGWPEIKREKFCTKEAMTGVCKLPPTPKMLACGRRGYKSPKLVEAYRHAFGRDFLDAHDAMADCRATAELFEWIKTNEAVVAISKVPQLAKSFDMLSVEDQEALPPSFLIPPHKFQPPPPLPVL